jgi:hypothetical protein
VGDVWERRKNWCINVYNIYISIYLSTYLPIYLSTYLPIYLSIYLSIYLGISSMYIYMCLYSIHLFGRDKLYKLSEIVIVDPDRSDRYHYNIF